MLPPRSVGAWLLVVCAAIALMVCIGGITRLTGSGLSITDWRPITGAVPPLSDADWQSEFAKYMGSPQHRLVFPNMTVEEFKGIYWWEWIHRFWGRMIGVIYALPLAFFWLKGLLPSAWKRKLLAGLLLGGLQGAMGWFMVQSGLVDRPSVSAYRLAAHLGLAVFIFGLLFAWALRILLPRARDAVFPGRWKAALHGFAGLLAFQILYGGFVAGTKTAMAYPTFPDLAGSWLPSAALWLEPGWRNVFENSAWIAFIHRWVGIALAVLGAVLAVRAGRRTGWPMLLGPGLGALLVLQVLLGVMTTLQSQGHIPVGLGVAHQANALLILSATLLLMHLEPARR